MKKTVSSILLFLGLSPYIRWKPTGKSYSRKGTFTNPILPSGADPYSTYYKGYYYYTHTLGNRLVLWKTKTLADLKNSPKKTIWKAPKNTNYSAGIWAPEFHIINGMYISLQTMAIIIIIECMF